MNIAFNIILSYGTFPERENMTLGLSEPATQPSLIATSPGRCIFYQCNFAPNVYKNDCDAATQATLLATSPG